MRFKYFLGWLFNMGLASWIQNDDLFLRMHCPRTRFLLLGNKNAKNECIEVLFVDIASCYGILADAPENLALYR